MNGKSAKAEKFQKYQGFIFKKKDELTTKYPTIRSIESLKNGVKWIT